MRTGDLQRQIKLVAREKIYVVDDDPDILNLFQKKLGENFEVITFLGATEIFSRFDKDHPKAIFIDIHMPNIDGIALLGHLLDHPSTSEIPVFCMSADKSLELVDRLTLKGAAGYLHKPFEISSFCSSISSLISGVNKKITNSDSNRSCTIAVGVKAKNNLLLECLYKSIEENVHRTLLLSWTTGEQFYKNHPQLQAAIDSEKLVHLEIRSSLIMKFPYLQSLVPIFSDLAQFVEYDRDKFHLIFDEPRNLYDVYDQERALSKTIALSRLIQTSFYKSDIFMTAAHNPTLKSFISKLAKIYTGKDQ